MRKFVRDGVDVIEMRRPDDFHVHLRQGELLPFVMYMFIDQGYGKVLAMPNTRPPILTAEDIDRYTNEIDGAIADFLMREGRPLHELEIYFTIQITEETTPKMVREAREAGVIAGKVYPKNMTTHSENGVLDYSKIYPVFQTMQEIGMVLSLHGEHPAADVEGLDKEEAFLNDILTCLVFEFPSLKIVLEHISTQLAVMFVEDAPQNVAATITPHHLSMTLDDVIGYSQSFGYLMRPHNMCKPVAKWEVDRRALLEAVTRGNPKFFYGSDTALHLKGNKECAGVCAGCFNTPAALPLLVHLFEGEESLEGLEDFLSRFGSEFYGLPLNTGVIEVQHIEMKVPDELTLPSGTVAVPWMAGEIIPWR